MPDGLRIGGMMKKISVLAPEVSQKIAAGEVIERPFSVVKELVENSLDAGATEVAVELRGGGKKSIKVQDNGCGMNREDAQLSLERHATSKISGEKDLERISTLGFRGEALASILAVSELTLKTSDGESGQGTWLEGRGEDLNRVIDTAFPRGTSVEVKNLFFNLPARQKFLRSDQSELTLVTRYLTGVALAFPEIRLSLHHGPREILNCSPVTGLRERIYQIYGKTVLEKIIEIDFREGDTELYGFASRPPFGRPDKSHQLLFVNRRPVRDRMLQAALNQAYKDILEKDLFPEAFLFLSLPFEMVDVNVHPAKAEVRFRDSGAVFRLVLRGLGRSLLKEKGIKEIFPLDGEAAGDLRVREEVALTSFSPREMAGGEKQREFPVWEKIEQGKTAPRVLGQYLNTYIIAASAEELLIIDQHNAHERVLFEKYKEIDSRKSWPQKIPLLPLLFDLSPSQVLLLEGNRELLEDSGFNVEAMGERTFVLNGFPGIFSAEEAKDILLSLLEELKEEKIEGKRDKLLATLACRTAIKANEFLPREKMDYLVDELFKTSAPFLCPHGRPIVIKVEKKQIEKGLKRMS